MTFNHQEIEKNGNYFGKIIRPSKQGLIKINLSFMP